MKVRYHLVIG